MGNRISAMTVICHCSRNMAVSVVVSTTTFDTTDPRVLVSARWAPSTSLFMRLIRAPVWVWVKNPIGIRCTWSNRRTRRS